MASTMSLNGELLEIFAHLPVKDIARYSCVSKSAKELFTENFFARKQSKIRESADETAFIIHPEYHPCLSFRGTTTSVELHASSRNVERDEPLVPHSSLEVLKASAAVVSSSNGLLLCRENTQAAEEHPFFLFNPATRNQLKIPSQDNVVTNFVFECNAHDITGGEDYLLMKIESTTPEWNWGEYRSSFYSPKERVWKDGHIINLGPRHIMFDNVIYQGGVVYMISDTGCYINRDDSNPYYWPYIVSYDIRDGASRLLKIPESARREGHLEGNPGRYKLKIFKFSNSKNVKTIILVRFHQSTFTIWQLTDAENGSWCRIFKNDAREMGIAEADHIDVIDFIVQNENTLLIATSEKVYRYDFPVQQGVTNGRVEEVCEHKIQHGFVRLLSFTSTLRPCQP